QPGEWSDVQRLGDTPRTPHPAWTVAQEPALRPPGAHALRSTGRAPAANDTAVRCARRTQHHGRPVAPYIPQAVPAAAPGLGPMSLEPRSLSAPVGARPGHVRPVQLPAAAGDARRLTAAMTPPGSPTAG